MVKTGESQTQGHRWRCKGTLDTALAHIGMERPTIKKLVVWIGRLE